MKRETAGSQFRRVVFGNDLIRRLLRKILPGTGFLRYSFFVRVGYFPRFRTPRTFNEKVNWRKLYHHVPVHVVVQDKLAVRDYVSQRAGDDVLIPLLLRTKDPKTISLDALPAQFVIKSNHASQQVHIVKNKSELDWPASLRLYEKWLTSQYGTRGEALEWAYQSIEPEIMVEQLLLDSSGEPPSDYKFYVFGGKVKAIQVDVDRFIDHGRTLFWPDWSEIPCELHYARPDRSIERPRNLERMISVAESIAAEFDFLRVDLYELDNHVYFGETALYPGSGREPFFPARFDRLFGDSWVLPEPTQVPSA